MRRLRGITLGLMLLGASGVAAAGGWGPQVTITNYFLWSHGGEDRSRLTSGDEQLTNCTLNAE